MRNVVATLVLLILFFTLLPSSSDGLVVWRRRIDGRIIKEAEDRLGRSKMMMVGSRPPKCVNRCSSCRPCMAALVIIGQQEKKKVVGGGDVIISSREEEDDSYYLLSWKCRCGDKFFPP